MANISKINFKGVEYDIKPLMDAVPTQGSANVVSSGGVWSALAERSAIICTVDTSGNATLQLGEEDLTEIAELIGGTA